MFLIDGKLRWSASDLTAAASCEFGILRMLDQKLGHAGTPESKPDPLMQHIARLGGVHEARLLAELEVDWDVAKLDHVEPAFTEAKLEAAHAQTVAAFESAPDIVFQAAFSDGEFFGYADFIERTDDGWLVCDAKLARSAKAPALLQLGAYADQIQALGLSTAPTVSLLLGNGERADFRVADVLPVFVERRARLRQVLAEHQGEDGPVAWGDERYVACGSCAECSAAAEEADDVIGVANLNLEQRRKLRAAGVASIGLLTAATTNPDGMAQATFEKLRAQARIQAISTSNDEVAYEITGTARKMLALLPAPSDGDLFFDFEGDPLYDEGDLSRIGLEYLWGFMDSAGSYTAIWAHDSAAEKAALVEFIDLVVNRRATHPDMHVYHYAPYETTALKRLAMRYQTREKELDDLLRSAVFVDLYATVRGSVRVGQPSYSIKKLEPLYMGEQLRSDGDDAVGDGGASVVAYHEYREWTTSEPVKAQLRLDALVDYNEYDCLSTLRLRDWLLERAEEAGVRDQIVPQTKAEKGEELSDKDPLFIALMARSGSENRIGRTAEEQSYAMLATALDYYRRERKQYWWEHFERLSCLVDDWGSTRDIFIVESAQVVDAWAVPGGKAHNATRMVRLVGDWTPGSKTSSGAQVVYGAPAPDKAVGPEKGVYATLGSKSVEVDTSDPRVVILTESRSPGETFDDLPVALVPGFPPRTENIEAAIREVAEDAIESDSLPMTATLDLLARRHPRIAEGGQLPRSGSAIADVVSALTAMTDSYVAIQGPPGTGKTYTGSHVIRELVEKHHWRIGVVAQSHAVVENVLASIVKTGLSPEVVGKDKNDSSAPLWTPTKKIAKFLDEHSSTGCVIGGTAWDFANENTVPRGSLDLLVIDEAGQFSLGPTLGASVAAQRLLLLGDPQQLPQVSQGTHAEPVDESALGWIMQGSDTLPSELGYFLGESYRMHPALCSKISTLSYADRLHSAPAASKRHLEGVAPGLTVVQLDHVSNRVESQEEADEVARQIQRLMGTAWSVPGEAPRGLNQSDFLVVAPYNAQVARIRRTLADSGLVDVKVGTVDKFQGQEAPVALVSMTASSHGDVPRGMGFLLSRNRVNVAVSRAQWRAILIRSSALTAYMPSTAVGLLELGGFIGLCSGPPQSPSATG